MKHLLLFIFCLNATVTFSQDRLPVTFYLVDGSEMIGYLKTYYQGTPNFEYSDVPTGPLQKLSIKKVHRVKITDGNKTHIFQVLDVLNQKDDKSAGYYVAEVILEGYMNLYYLNNDYAYEYLIKPSPNAKGVYFAAYAEGPQGGGTFKAPKKILEAYNKKFIKNAAVFFQDHPEISKEFAEGTVHFVNFKEMVIRYNAYKNDNP